MKLIANFGTKANFKGQSDGFDFTLTIGIGGGWMALFNGGNTCGQRKKTK